MGNNIDMFHFKLFLDNNESFLNLKQVKKALKGCSRLQLVPGAIYVYNSDNEFTGKIVLQYESNDLKRNQFVLSQVL